MVKVLGSVLAALAMAGAGVVQANGLTPAPAPAPAAPCPPAMPASPPSAAQLPVAPVTAQLPAAQADGDAMKDKLRGIPDLVRQSVVSCIGKEPLAFLHCAAVGLLDGVVVMNSEVLDVGKKFGEATGQEFAAMIASDRAAVQACIAGQDDPDSFHACVKTAFKAAQEAANGEIIKAIALDVVDLLKSLKKCAHGQATEKCVIRKVRDALSCFLTGRRRDVDLLRRQTWQDQTRVPPPLTPVLGTLIAAPAPAPVDDAPCIFPMLDTKSAVNQ